MEKVIRKGKVAVLYSPDHGAGWFTWNSDHQELLFHPKLIEMVENGRAHQITEEWVLEHLGIPDVYCDGAYKLKIKWLDEGTAFRVEEYDGYESITTMENLMIIA